VSFSFRSAWRFELEPGAVLWVLVFFANRAARYAYDWRHAAAEAPDVSR
jgi:hypothetical protein